MALFSSSLENLQNGLDGTMLRQKTIADNIANVDTPNYKARQAHFQHTLQEAEQNLHAYTTNSRHIEFGGRPRDAYVSVDQGRTYNHNGNSVDMDKEMAEMANNQIYYSALVDRLDGQFGSLKTAVRGGN